MSNKMLIILCAGTFALLFSCQNATENKGEKGSESTEAPKKYTARDGHTIGMNVILNNGAKWEANVETTQGMGHMLGTVGDMPAQPTLEDFRSLHKTLNVKFETILQQCTMAGEAHNQLHNYLMPLKEKIDVLETADLKTCKKLLPELKEYIMKYSHFFFT
ncbi:MAG: hypothetical protein SH808_10350 [Saprospiraceae bacterium]|nr:hypothetical protein [Saprospiraceae bacterium]